MENSQLLNARPVKDWPIADFENRGYNMKRLLLLAIIFSLFCAATCHASWLIFHKPEFKGKIVDIETNEPIEGAVVVAVYRTHSLAVGDSVDYDIGAQEALTDKNGEFRIPSYTTMIQPLSWSIPTMFTIFKPGYLCNGPSTVEEEFSGSGTMPVRETFASWNPALKYKVTNTGIYMLPKVEGKDRIESLYRTGPIESFTKNKHTIRLIMDKERSVVIGLERQWRNIK